MNLTRDQIESLHKKLNELFEGEIFIVIFNTGGRHISLISNGTETCVMGLLKEAIQNAPSQPE